MTALDEKSPAPPGGANDLLDALVHDHLERASAESMAGVVVVQPDAAAPDDDYIEPESPPPLPPAVSAENLQREIESLLSGEPNAQAPIERAATAASAAAGAAPSSDDFADFPAHAPDADPVSTDLAATAALAPPPGENISSAELEVLLKDQPPAPTQITSPDNPLAPPADELEEKLTEADGVMAEELAQLIAETRQAEETGAAPAPAASAVAIPAASSTETSIAAPTAPVPAELAAAVQSIMDNPIQMHDAHGAPKPPVPPLEPAAANTAPTEAPTASTETPPVLAETSPTTSVMQDAATQIPAQSAPATPSAKPALPVRLWHLVLSILVMILQIIDMPFGFIKETDKNVIGIAAFIFLLSGLALKLCSLWLLRQH